VRSHQTQGIHRGLERTVGFRSKISGHHGHIVIGFAQPFDQCTGEVIVHVEVHITEVKQCEAVEGGREPGDWDFIVPQLDSERIASPAAM
jgi:hypothetical protein